MSRSSASSEGGGPAVSAGQRVQGVELVRRQVVVHQHAVLGGAVIAAYCLALTALGFLNPVWETVVQREFPPEVLARVTSYDWLMSLGAIPIGYALAPLATRQWGASTPLAVAGVLVAVAVPAVRRLRWTVSVPPEPAVPAGR